MAVSARDLLSSICWSKPAEEAACLYVCLLVCLSPCLSVYMTVCVSACLSVCLPVCTSQGAQGVVQLLGVAIDASQSLLGVGLGHIDSVQQLVESLQRQKNNLT